MKDLKKIAMLIITIALSVICTSTVVSAYTDIAGGWYEDIVNYSTKHGIINGYADNTFRPNNTVSKAEVIKLVVARYMDPASANSGEHWAMPYVRYAEANNIIVPGMYTKDNLDLPASRKEICYMLINACRYIAYKPVLDDTDMVLDFDDLNDKNKHEINENGIDYAKAMHLCYAMGIIKGYPTFEMYDYIKEDGTTVTVYNDLPNLIKPDGNITRAECITLITRTYFSKYREYILIERTGNQLPSNASDFPKTYTYMPKSFYEDGKDSFFEYVKGENAVHFYNSTKLDYSKGKARLENAYDVLFNISYKMTDEQWSLWKEETKIFTDIGRTGKNLDEYIQFIKDNKIVIRGGYIVDPMTAGRVYSKIYKQSDNKKLIKGIGTLYIENPNNVEDISLAYFLYSSNPKKLNSSLPQNYVYSNIGLLKYGYDHYINDMELYTEFFFENPR